MNASCPLALRVQVAGSCFISLKYRAVITSVMPREPPGWPEPAAETIRTMSLRTCEAMELNS